MALNLEIFERRKKVHEWTFLDLMKIVAEEAATEETPGVTRDYDMDNIIFMARMYVEREKRT